MPSAGMLKGPLLSASYAKRTRDPLPSSTTSRSVATDLLSAPCWNAIRPVFWGWLVVHVLVLHMHLPITKLLCTCALIAALDKTLAAGEPLRFPWGVSQSSFRLASPPGAAHVILPSGSHRPTLPVYSAPPKAPFAYGWFGSNPVPYSKPSWGRHFGYLQNFTQWTSR